MFYFLSIGSFIKENLRLQDICTEGRTG